MMYESRDDGLYEIRHDSEPVKLCGPIQVKAIVSDKARRNGFGLLLEWKNLVGNTFQEVLPMEEIDDYSAKKLRQRLRRSGFVISPRRNSWDKVLCYLIETRVDEHAISSNTTGWVDKSFVTPGWTVNNGDEKVIFSGPTSTEHLAIKGSLESWKDQVGTLCQHNPVLIFSICTALAAPLIHWLSWDSCGFHLVGQSKSGKTTAMQIAASVCSDESYWDTWRSTANGLEAISASRNDMLLCLDEFHQASPEDVDQAIYMLANGVSKIRSNQDGSLAARSRWKLLFLSTGEIGLSEMLFKIKQEVKAGQLIRFNEIPIIGKYGVFDYLHGFKSAKQFADELRDRVKNNHGSLLYPWLIHLSNVQNISQFIRLKIEELTDKWEIESAGNQVGYALDRFALLAVAGELAIQFGLVPWSKGDVENAIYHIVQGWITARGFEGDAEEQFIINKAPLAIKAWNKRLTLPGKELTPDLAGYWKYENNELAWFITRDSFKNGFGLKQANARKILELSTLLAKKEWLQTNESSRGTFKVKPALSGETGKQERYYKIYPQRICTELSLIIDFPKKVSQA